MVKKGVLLIDDHQEFRRMLRSFIEKQLHNVEVKEAISGKDGVEVAIKERPQIVLIDVHLPLIDGIETARQIKKCVPRCQIIAMSMFQSNGYTRDVLVFIKKEKIDSELIPILYRLTERR